MVVAQVHSHVVDDAPLCSDGKQCRRVFAHFLSVAELVHGCNLARLVHGRLVLHVHLGLELILGSYVEVAEAVVDADDRGYSQSGLVAEQVHSLGVFLQLVEAFACALECLLCGLELSFLDHKLLGRGDSGIGVLLYTSINLCYCACYGVYSAVDQGRRLLHEAAEVDPSGCRVHLNVANLGFVGGIAVEQSQTAVDRKVGRNLVGCAHLHSEVVLAALHISVHIVAFHSGSRLSEGQCQLVEALQLVGYAAHNALEGPQTVGKLTLAAAARHREIELHAPVALVPGSLKRGDARCIGYSLEHFCALVLVLAPQRKHWIGRSYGACLVGILPVEGEVEPFREESNACRVAVDSVEAYRAVAGRVAEEVNTLVGVCQDASCKGRGTGCQQHGRAENRFLVHTKYLFS